MISLNTKFEVAYLNLIPEDNPFNLLNTKTIKELIINIESLYESPAKVLKIFGENGSFAVGADIKTMLNYSGFTAKGFSILGNRLFKLLQDIPQITIAEIDGFCMGGGMDFAAACDFRFATKNSKFAHPGAKLGIITGFGGTQRITRIMKYSYYNELFISGDIYDSEFMYNSNYLYNISNDLDELKNYTANFIEKLINKPKLFLQDMKHKTNSHL
jgi:enoyl-CoA hydratase